MDCLMVAKTEKESADHQSFPSFIDSIVRNCIDMMAESSISNTDNFDSWLETVITQCDNRRISAQISLRTLKSLSGAKEHHVNVISDDDECFFYRTVINQDEYRKLAASNSFIASFDNLPQYFRQLLRAANQENEYGQSYLINIVASGSLGLTPRIELLITTRQPGLPIVQNKVLGLPMTAATDTEFKEYLTTRFERMKKEKDQLRRSASFLESQLRRERARSREMEDKNHWLRKELKFTQNLLKSAESIQKHYEVILSLRHRGETGSTVVTIGDLASPQGRTSVEPQLFDVPSDSMPSTSGFPSGNSYHGMYPLLHKTSTCSYSQTSDDDDHSRATKPKVSFSRTNDTDSESEEDNTFGESSSNLQERKNPPPRKFAAAVLPFDDKLIEIRKQEERKRSGRTSDEESEPGKQAGGEDRQEWTIPRKVARMETGPMESEDRQSHLLPSPFLSRPMSPPSVTLPPHIGTDRMAATSSKRAYLIAPPSLLKDGTAGTSRIFTDAAADECPSDAK